MKIKVISCEIFRWICEENKLPNYDYVFYEIAQHYDIILLLCGLLGNAINNLTS